MKWHRKEPSNRWIIGKLNDMPIRRKLIALFIFCILFPLVSCRYRLQDLEMSPENNEKDLQVSPSF